MNICVCGVGECPPWKPEAGIGFLAAAVKAICEFPNVDAGI